MTTKPTFNEALKFWIKLGFISFGGPAGQIAIMHEYLVENRKWISPGKFLHALNYCMILPGPEAQQLATYIGWLLHGRVGGVMAGVLFVLPSMFILLGLSMIYVTFGNIPYVAAIFVGLKPAVIAIVILALIKIGVKSLHGYYHYAIAAISFICIYFLNIPFPAIIIGAIVAAILFGKLFPKLLLSSTSNAGHAEVNENEYLINKYSTIPNTGFNVVKFLKQVIIFTICWFAPFSLFYFVTSDFEFWKILISFFTKAAFVTLGGAYAVLPYVAQVSVEKYHWLNNFQMIDGLALGETTPGPLIMVLAFVGFMAGFNHFESSLLMGSLGLVITTFYTFLPCFFFILAGAPIIEKTQDHQTVKQVMGLVTAAVTGVILNLTIYLGKAVIFPQEISFTGFDYISLAWILLSLFVLFFKKINMLKWIGISGIFGLIQFFFL